MKRYLSKVFELTGKKKEELYFDNLLMFEPVENAPVDNYAEDNRKFFFEIFEKENLLQEVIRF